MRLVKLTAADIERLKAALPAQKADPQAFHQEELTVDALTIGLVRPETSDDPRTNTHSIGFRSGDTQYVIVVRPTVHQVPAITLNVITNTEVSSYTLLKDTVTTLTGHLSGLPADRTPANFDLAELIGHLKLS